MFSSIGSIIGALTGGFFGFIFLAPLGMGFFGGIIGAIAGANIGNLISRGTIHAYRKPGGTYTGSHQSKTFFESLFSMIAAVTIADGTIDDEEKETIRLFMKNQLRLNVEAQAVAMDIFNQAVSSRVPIEHSATRYYRLYRYDRQLLTMAVDILLRVAYANNEYHPKEEEEILKVVRIFMMPADVYEQIRSRYTGGGSSSYSSYGSSSGYSSGSGNNGSYGSSSSAVSSAYSILGCSESATDQEIKKAYRKMANEYHPDKVASKGLPKEFADFAQEKFKEVQSAYDTIKKVRGIS